MSTDVRIRVDQFFKSKKTLEGYGHWHPSERTNLHKFQRQIAEDGVSHGFTFEVNAHLDSSPREFRFMITGLGACLCRLDCAPITDPVHVNGPQRLFGLPFAIDGNHFHPWAENRVFSTASDVHKKLPYALESNGKIATMEQGFWQF